MIKRKSIAMIKKILFILWICLSYSINIHAQYFEWISHNPSQYSLNPDMVKSPLSISSSGDEVNARLDSFAIHYNLDALGKIDLEKRDATGMGVWTIPLGKKVSIKKIAIDQSDNIYIAGGFMDTLNFNGMGQLMNTSSGTNVDQFLAKFDSNGTLLWNRNLSLSSNQINVEDIQIDINGNLWYATNNFNSSALYMVDGNGDDIDSLLQDGSLILSSFSFDPFGNIFIAGSTESGTMTFGNQSYTVTNSYNKYIGRYDSNRNASWAYFANDITFQHPKVVSDVFGNAYFAGEIFDSTNFGTLTFPNPQWSTEFILVKIDSSGNFLWGKSNPAGTAPITGRLSALSSDCIGTDQAGNIYLSGSSAGILDWGNGVVLTAGLGQLHENRSSIISFDPNGDIRWGKIFGSETYNSLHSLKVNANGDCYFNAGYRDNTNFDSLNFVGNSLLNFVTGKISASVITGVTELKVHDYSIYPVPSTSTIHFKGEQADAVINVFDINGKLVRSQVQNTGNPYDISDLPNGCYRLNLSGEKLNENFTFVKLTIK